MAIHKLMSPLKCHPAARRCHRPVVRSLRCWLSEGIWNTNAIFSLDKGLAFAHRQSSSRLCVVLGRIHVPICFSDLCKSFLVTRSRKLKRKSLQLNVFTGRKGRKWKNGVALTGGKVLIPKFVVAPL